MYRRAALLTAIFLSGVPALAQEETRTGAREAIEPTEIDEKMPHMGATLGVYHPEKGYEQSSIYGLQLGLKPYYGIKIGAEFLRTATTSPIQLRDRTLLMFNTTLTSPNLVKVEWYIGLGVGAVLDTVHNVTHLSFAGHPFAGADFPLGAQGISRNSFSLGARVGYMAVTDHSYGFDFSGILKYWL